MGPAWAPHLEPWTQAEMRQSGLQRSVPLSTPTSAPPWGGVTPEVSLNLTLPPLALHCGKALRPGLWTPKGILRGHVTMQD